MLKQLIWDWNGTLMDDAWLCVWSVNKLLEELGVPQVTLDHYLEHFGWPVESYYAKVGVQLDRMQFEALSHRFIGLYESRRSECELHPGVTKALETLARYGMRQVVLSAYLQKSLGGVIEHYGLTGFFQELIGNPNIFAGSKVANAKAHLARSGLNPEEVMVIGDTLHDFEVAESIGSPCLLVANGHTARHRLIATGAPVVDSAAEVPEFLEGAEIPISG